MAAFCRAWPIVDADCRPPENEETRQDAASTCSVPPLDAGYSPLSAALGNGSLAAALPQRSSSADELDFFVGQALRAFSESRLDSSKAQPGPQIIASSAMAVAVRQRQVRVKAVGCIMSLGSTIFMDPSAEARPVLGRVLGVTLRAMAQRSAATQQMAAIRLGHGSRLREPLLWRAGLFGLFAKPRGEERFFFLGFAELIRA